MPERRRDPLTGQTVILAEARAAKPSEFAPGSGAGNGAPRRCPFCPGHEADTRPETAALREPDSAPDGPGWQVRFVPNLYPALDPDAPDAERGFGVHEVVIDAPEHVASLAELPDEQVERLLRACRDRVCALAADPRLRSALLFKNVGPEAGASIEHGHCQLMAIPFVPELLERRLALASEAWTRLGRCPSCVEIEALRADGERVFVDDPEALALCPVAPRTPYEARVLPVDHAGGFEDASDASLRAVARVLRRAVQALERVIEPPHYNVVFVTAPLRSRDTPGFHWHVEIVPRILRTAGFEWGTGVFVHALPPHRAAARLRGSRSGGGAAARLRGSRSGGGAAARLRGSRSGGGAAARLRATS